MLYDYSTLEKQNFPGIIKRTALVTFVAAIKGYTFQTGSLITLISIISKRVESSDGEVEHAGQVERDASPKREVPGEPEQSLVFCAKENGEKV